MYPRLLQEVDMQLELARKLSELKAVKIHDRVDEPESWRIAHDLSEIEDSFFEIFSKFVPQLLKESDPEKIQELLEDIGHQVRHISYHMHNSSYLQAWANDLPSGDE